MEKLEEIASIQWNVQNRLAEIESKSWNSEWGYDATFLDCVTQEPVAMPGTTWYYDIPRIEFIEKVVEVPKVVFVDKVVEKVADAFQMKANDAERELATRSESKLVADRSSETTAAGSNVAVELKTPVVRSSSTLAVELAQKSSSIEPELQTMIHNINTQSANSGLREHTRVTGDVETSSENSQSNETQSINAHKRLS